MNKRLKIALIVGGVIGIASLAIFINFRSRKIKRIAKSFKGVEEIGDNQSFSNETLQKMLKEAGWKSGEAWCMYYAKAIYQKALPRLADKIQKELTGSTQGTWNKINSGDSEIFETITSGKPRVGDIVIWRRLNDSSKGHAAIVTKPRSSKYPNGYTTIEGNTNYDPSFQGEGDLVDSLEHELKYGQTNDTYKGLKLLGFIRLK
jgi:hypothetical protein